MTISVFLFKLILYSCFSDLFAIHIFLGFEEIEYEEEPDGHDNDIIKPDDGKANANVPKTENIHLSEIILPVTPFPACRLRFIFLS